MAHAGEIRWFCPARRGLIPLDNSFHVPHGLRRSLRHKPFDVRWNTAFREVMIACAAREDTWIDGVILESYCALHAAGHAHSVECWDDEGLQGGLYGVELPGVFFGESMFFNVNNASKVALYALVEYSKQHEFKFIDCQVETSHLMRSGATLIPRKDYLAILAEAIKKPACKGRWTL